MARVQAEMAALEKNREIDAREHMEPGDPWEHEYYHDIDGGRTHQWALSYFDWETYVRLEGMRGQQYKHIESYRLQRGRNK